MWAFPRSYSLEEIRGCCSHSGLVMASAWYDYPSSSCGLRGVICWVQAVQYPEYIHPLVQGLVRRLSATILVLWCVVCACPWVGGQAEPAASCCARGDECLDSKPAASHDMMSLTTPYKLEQAPYTY